MSYATDTLLGMIQLNDNNLADFEVSNLLQDAPFLAAVEASNGTVHKYLRKTAAPGFGFRDVNSGILNAAGEEDVVTRILKYLDASLTRDIALARSHTKGPAAYMERELQASLQAAFFGAERQIINGTGGIATGFEGLRDLFANLNNIMVVNAAGTSAGTVKTSVYLVRSAIDAVAVVAGNSGKIEIGEMNEVECRDSSDLPYTGLRIDVGGWLGFQAGNSYSAVRIANITNETGKGLTDALIAEAISRFPSGRGPTHILCNRTTQMQLQKSRTATSPTGAPAPFPTEVQGVPLVVTDAIANTETLLTT